MVWKPIKCILRPPALFTKLNGPFLLYCVTLYCFERGFHEDVTYQHPLFVNNSNDKYYFTNYSTKNRSVSTNDQLNRKTNHIINNLPNSETAPLIRV